MFLIRQIIRSIQLLFPHVLVDGFVFTERGEVRHENWGDDINYYFLKNIVCVPLLIYNQLSIAFRFNPKHYLIIGSVIDMLCKPNTIVWGSGILHGPQTLRVKPLKVLAVRGPLTRVVLLDNNIECPEIYGDPALLLPLYYAPKIEKKYKYGIINHNFSIDGYDTLTMDGQKLDERTDVLKIDLSKYEKWTDIIDQILSCDGIISYSLHGLIVSEAYKVPNVWIEFDEVLYGGHFKFHDFFLSIGRDREKPVAIKNKKIESKVIDKALSSWKPGSIDLQPLINACPFAINLRK